MMANNDNSFKIGKGRKYLTQTFGCQMNERDSEILAGMLKEMDYSPTENVEEADLILFNTCCVREKAENKVLSRLGELRELKSKNPEMIIGVCGCMTQQENIAEKIRHRAPHVELIFGTHNIHQLPDLIAKILETREPQIAVWTSEGDIVEDLPSQREYPFKALVNITFGCNNFCTYCIVPYVRGRERSREPEHIVKEIEKLVSEGVHEVMLLGQNVNSYGKDFDKPTDFADLLQAINGIENLARARYMTSHPRDFSDKLIEVIKNSSNICEHFHLPIQSGSNNILHKMNRGYTREYYLDLVRKIRQAVPNCSITTDIIVGFPGETEEDFQATISLMKEVRYDAAFSFVYSRRTGTPAATMPNQVADGVKKRRLQELMEVQNQISNEINQQLLGKEVEVLVEGPSKTDPSTLSGKTRTNKTVLFVREEGLEGKLVKVKITQPQTWTLKGELVK